MVQWCGGELAIRFVDIFSTNEASATVSKS